MLLKIKSSEKQAVLKAIKSFKKSTVSVAKIAAKAKCKESRTRFIVDMLVEEGLIKKHIARDLSPRYKRYYYEVMK